MHSCDTRLVVAVFIFHLAPPRRALKNTCSIKPAAQHLQTQKCKLLQPKAVKDRSAWAPPPAARHTWKRQAS